MLVELKVITPEIAEQMLKHNTGNRKIRRSHVRNLSIAMSRGDFLLSHQGIAFDVNGNLIDGQHRLHAVIESGEHVEMMVFSGCDRKTFSILDVGAKRGFQDATGQDHFMAQVANLVILLHKKRASSCFAETLEYCDLISDDYYKIFPNKRSCKIFSSAVFRLGVLYAFMDGKCSEHYARYSAYAMQHEKFEAMTPRIASAYRRLSKFQGTRGAVVPLIFTISAHAFDESLQDTGSILIKDGVVERVINDFRKLIEKLTKSNLPSSIKMVQQEAGGDG